jgi:hypothetical protein
MKGILSGGNPPIHYEYISKRNASALLLNINVHYSIHIGRFIELYPMAGIGGRYEKYKTVIPAEKIEYATTLYDLMYYFGGGMSFHLNQQFYLDAQFKASSQSGIGIDCYGKTPKCFTVGLGIKL